MERTPRWTKKLEKIPTSRPSNAAAKGGKKQKRQPKPIKMEPPDSHEGGPPRWTRSQAEKQETIPTSRSSNAAAKGGKKQNKRQPKPIKMEPPDSHEGGPPRWTRSQAEKQETIITSSDPLAVNGPSNDPCVKEGVKRDKPIKLGKHKPRRSAAAPYTNKEVTRRSKRKCVCVTHIRGFCVTIYTGHKLQDEAHRRCKHFLKKQARTQRRCK